MRHIPTEIIDTGIDFSTFTFSDPKNAEIAVSKAAILLQSEQVSGNDKRLWHQYGYEGFSCGGVRLASRADSVLVSLSGASAQQHWQKFLPLASNCSRLDLQITGRFEISSSTMIARHYKAAARRNRSGKCKRKVTLLRATDDSATIYVGSRFSDYFGRVYQKDRESGLEHYQNAIRYELEVKGKSALPLAKHIIGHSSPQVETVSLIRHWFNVAGIVLELPEQFHNSFIRISTSLPDDIKSLEWLTRDVKPTVQKLIRNGKLSMVLSALGLSDELLPSRDLLAVSSTPGRGSNTDECTSSGNGSNDTEYRNDVSECRTLQ